MSDTNSSETRASFPRSSLILGLLIFSCTILSSGVIIKGLAVIGLILLVITLGLLASKVLLVAGYLILPFIASRLSSGRSNSVDKQAYQPQKRLPCTFIVSIAAVVPTIVSLGLSIVAFLSILPMDEPVTADNMAGWVTLANLALIGAIVIFVIAFVFFLSISGTFFTHSRQANEKPSLLAFILGTLLGAAFVALIAAQIIILLRTL